MGVILFIVILLVLVVGHEFGHLLAAKAVGMRVLEFGIGFPPKLGGKKIGETEYTINMLPFGGFVRIFGEDPHEAVADTRAFVNQSAIKQAVTIAAGPVANVFLAFLAFFLAFSFGVTSAIDPNHGVIPRDARVVVLNILPGSPAERADLRSGDTIVSLTESGVETPVLKPHDVSALVQTARGEVAVSFLRDGESYTVSMTPEKGIIDDSPDTLALGLGTALVGTVALPFFEALPRAFLETWENTLLIGGGLLAFIGSAFTLSANLETVAGPVGIASLVSDASAFGLGSLFSFAAFISLNLAVVNLLPFPALDGGRLAFLAFEGITRKKIPLSFAHAANSIGFALLIILMLIVTAQDVGRLLG